MNKKTSQEIEKAYNEAVQAKKDVDGTIHYGIFKIRRVDGLDKPVWICELWYGLSKPHNNGSGNTVQDAYTALLHDINGTDVPPF